MRDKRESKEPALHRIAAAIRDPLGDIRASTRVNYDHVRDTRVARVARMSYDDPSNGMSIVKRNRASWSETIVTTRSPEDDPIRSI